MVKNKRLFSSILSIIMLCLALNVTPAKAQEPSIKTSRLSGNDRYETSVAISKSGWMKADTVIITTGHDFPDALSSSSLAKLNDSPILLTEKNAMKSITLDEIKRLKATKAILVGGTNVIGKGVENQLKDLGISTTRIGGSDRYDTSKKIAENIGLDNGIIIATGMNFPDALSIAPIAGIKSMPILLSPKTNLDNGIEKLIKGKKIPVSYIVGGKNVLDSKIEKSIPNSKRLGGANRYDTNLNINSEFASDLNFDTIYLATGNDFPDALSGSALAAKNNAPIFLTDKNSITPDIIYLIKERNIKHVVVIGGYNVVSKNVEDIVSNRLEEPDVNTGLISLSKTSAGLIIGDTWGLGVTIDNIPCNIEKDLVWSSSNENVAVVDENGLITAVGEGTATITVKIKGTNNFAKCIVTVKNPAVLDQIKPVCINSDEDLYDLMYKSIKEHKHNIYIDITNLEKDDERDPSWKIYEIESKVINENKDLDIISQMDIRENFNNIYTINLDYYYFIDNSYSYADLNINASIDKKVLFVGDNTKISIENIDKDSSNEIKYTIKDESIASIDKDGNVKALSNGETEIILDITQIIKSEGQEYNCSYTMYIHLYVYGKDTEIIDTLDDLKTAIKNGIGQDSLVFFINKPFTRQEISDTVEDSIVSHVTGDYEFYIYICGEYNKILYNYPASIGKEGFANKYNRVMDKADEIIQSIIKPGMSDIQKEFAIHDYLVLNAKYDYDNYLKNTMPKESFSPYGILVDGVGVCQGYAEAAKLLFDKAGIESYILFGLGNGGSHAWNMVKIGDKYYQLDITWDDPVPDEAGYVRYNYFNLSDKEISKDHTQDKNQDLPKCDDNRFNYLRENYINTNSIVKRDDKYFYFVDRSLNLSKIAYDGSVKDILCNEKMYNYKISGDYIIYYGNDDWKLYKIKYDGTDKTKLPE